MGLVEKVIEGRVVGRKSWSQPPFWDLDRLRYPFLGSSSLSGNEERIETDFEGYVEGIYKRNGPVASLMFVRLMVFSEARFQFRRLTNGRPGDLFGTQALGVLERPWPGATTGDLLSRMIVNADLAGNAFLTVVDGRVRVLRPDWVTIVSGSRSRPDLNGTSLAAAMPDATVIAYIYAPRLAGSTTGAGFLPGEPPADPDITVYTADQVAHFAPIPDPVANWRGMSWVTPILREITADSAATKHKLKFFENGASPALAVRLDPSVSAENFKKFKAIMDAEHGGVDQAYKCLHPETQVAMWDGSLRGAAEVKPGEQVVAWAGGRAVPGRVSAAEWQPPSPIVTVRTQRGRVIKTSDRHPFMARRVIRQGRKYLSDEMWIEADDLRSGDLLTPGLGWARDDVEDSVTPYQAWVLGAIVGDGCTISSTPVISAWDEGVRARLEIGHTLKSTGKGHDYRMLGVRALCGEAGLLGKRSWEKRIPEQIVAGSAKVKGAFLSGLLDTDGHVADPGKRRSAEIGITSTSRDLLADAQHLFASLGINCSVSLSMPAGEHGRSRNAWRLCIFGNWQAERLQAILDLACQEKARRLVEYAARPGRDDRSRYDRVVSVEVGMAEPTVGLEIAEHHTHVTGGVVTHNTLYLGGGADVTPLTMDLKQLDFKVTQGAGESRLAAAAGVPPVIVGFSEGLAGSSLNAGNYSSSRRRFADGTLRPLWRNAAGSLATLVTVPSGAELWYDDRDIAFLREDRKDAADIDSTKAQTIRTLIDAGFEPDSVIDAVNAEDFSLLRGRHSGLFSVQLQPPGSGQTAPAPNAVPAIEPSLNGHSSNQ